MTYNELIKAVTRIEAAAWDDANRAWEAKGMNIEELQNMGAIYDLSIYSPNWLVEESWSFPPNPDIADYHWKAFNLLESFKGLIAWESNQSYKVCLYDSFFGSELASFEKGV
ncbi:MAG: hypothetical protein WC476_00775 [Phycisphaerae bacterium]|jgi:hypothetical protein